MYLGFYRRARKLRLFGFKKFSAAAGLLKKKKPYHNGLKEHFGEGFDQKNYLKKTFGIDQPKVDVK